MLNRLRRRRDCWHMDLGMCIYPSNVDGPCIITRQIENCGISLVFDIRGIVDDFEGLLWCDVASSASFSIESGG